MGVITIRISKGKPGRSQTSDKAPALATMYAGLYDRLHKALADCLQDGKTHDDYDPDKHPHAPAGQANGGQFTATPGGSGPVGPKPTSVKAKLTKGALHELLSTGHAFSKKELLDIMGPEHKEVTVNTWLSKFKSQKHAGDYGALDIKKLPNGSYQVVMPNGQPAPPAPAGMDLEPTEETPLKDLLVKPPKAKEPLPAAKPVITVPFQPVSKDQADMSYKGQIMKGQQVAFTDIVDGGGPVQAVMKFKAAKQTALAQWATNTTGTLHEPKIDGKVYEADKILAGQLATAIGDMVGDDDDGSADVAMADAYAEWKTNTQLEKQGKLGAPAAPKPDTKTLASATKHWLDATKNEPAPKPVGYDVILPKDFKHVTATDIEASGTKSFGYGMTTLKSEMGKMGKADPVANKKMVEASLQEHLKDKKHFQALKAAYEATSPSEKTLERRLVASWAGSSGDGNPLSCALQMATQDAFQQPKDAITHKSLSSVEHSGGHNDTLTKQAAQKMGLALKTPEECEGFRRGLQEFIHGQYENTQAMLKKMGREHVFLARGMTVVPGSEAFGKEPADVKLQPASSFSSNYSTAKGFAGHGGAVYLVKVPASQVLGTYLTGFGCSNEHEVVVLGHDTIKSFPVPAQNAGSLSEALEQVKEQIKKGKHETY